MCKKLFTFSVLFVLFTVSIVFPQQALQNRDIDPSITGVKIEPTIPVTEATWDVEFDYDATVITGAAGNAGAVYIPTLDKFWTSRWATAVAHQWNSDGTLDVQFNLPFSGTRGMAFDGQFIYCSINTSTVQIVDPVSRSLIGTVPVSAAPNGARSITYNPDGDGGLGSLIVGNWTSPNLSFYEFSMSGTLLRTIASTVTGVYGIAYDNWSVGGPFLWVWSQGSGAGTPQYIMQMDYTAGTYTGVQHDVISDVGLGNAQGIAGGLFVTDDLVPGKAILGGLLQGTPDKLFGYELALTGPPCPIDPPTNPTPANGATNVSINPGNASWTNGAGATQLEILFGPVGNLQTVYTGGLITQLPIPGPLNYSTTYGWRVIGKNDTCQTVGPTWTFTTMADPLLVPEIALCYPLNVDYWTGSTNGTAKTEVSLVKGVSTEDGWFMFDVTNVITSGTIIDSIKFHGFVNQTNWPYWSATPLPGLNPLTATAAELKDAIQANSASGTAYIYSNEASTFTTGQKTYTMGTNSHTPFLNSLSQGWFAMGMDSRDNSATYFINWDGWNQTNKPYLEVFYRYVIPVELTSFTASASVSSVTLKWSTATETNNHGFEVQRSSGEEFHTITFVQGQGTATEIRNYSYIDKDLKAGHYSYRLKQVDYNGNFEYSNVVEAEVIAPSVFALEQNYPNPFNPSTTINFSLAVDSKISLKIFNVLGQEVASLLNGQMSAGSQKVSFDASSLNSGVYFYRLEADGIDGQKFSSTKKMILTK
mgnify:CR=1 FL=1